MSVGGTDREIALTTERGPGLSDDGRFVNFAARGPRQRGRPGPGLRERCGGYRARPPEEPHGGGARARTGRAVLARPGRQDRRVRHVGPSCRELATGTGGPERLQAPSSTGTTRPRRRRRPSRMEVPAREDGTAPSSASRHRDRRLGRTSRRSNADAAPGTLFALGTTTVDCYAATRRQRGQGELRGDSGVRPDAPGASRTPSGSRSTSTRRTVLSSSSPTTELGARRRRQLGGRGRARHASETCTPWGPRPSSARLRTAGRQRGRRGSSRGAWRGSPSPPCRYRTCARGGAAGRRLCPGQPGRAGRRGDHDRMELEEGRRSRRATSRTETGTVAFFAGERIAQADVRSEERPRRRAR